MMQVTPFKTCPSEGELKVNLEPVIASSIKVKFSKIKFNSLWRGVCISAVLPKPCSCNCWLVAKGTALRTMVCFNVFCYLVPLNSRDTPTHTPFNTDCGFLTLYLHKEQGSESGLNDWIFICNIFWIEWLITNLLSN